MKHVRTVCLPDIGEGIAEGEVIKWLKGEGDLLLQDEPIVVVMTDKATVELPAPFPGKLSKIHRRAGQISACGEPLYEIEVEEEASSQEEPKKALQKAPVTERKAPEQKAAAHGLATPPVRQLAKKLHIDLDQVPGTGEGGRISQEDLQDYIQHPMKQEDELLDDEIRPLIGIPLLMAKRMAISKAHIPHFSYFEIVDASRLAVLREKLKEEAGKDGLKVTFSPLIIRALSICIVKYPEMNSSFEEKDHALVLHRRHHIGIAMRSPFGLIVPVLKDVQTMSLKAIIQSYEALKEKALSGKLHPDDMKGSTLTLTNFGAIGSGQFATPVINYPEAAILGIAKVQKQPFVRNDQLVIREGLNLSWSFDHRIIDGEKAALISHEMAQLLQNPAALL